MAAGQQKIFSLLHERLHALYVDECCEPVQLAAGKDKYAKVKKAYGNATDFIYENKGFSAADLNHKTVKELTKQTYSLLKEAVDYGITYKVPDAMRQALQNNVYIFSGLKTYASLKEASGYLMDANGNVKPLDAFKQDIAKLDANYNQNYLEAEYQFATGSAQSAAQWQQYAQDGDRYDLQYRTAKDDHVRASHKVLDGITLPVDSPFWDLYWTPNGWRCRCKIVQVRKGKFSVTDIDFAMKAGEDATTELDKNGNNKAAMFRFNPGKQNAIFPANHPYLKLAPEAAKKIVTEQATEETGAGWKPGMQITSNADLNAVMRSYAEAYSQYFERGFGSLSVSKNSRLNGATDKVGNIELSPERMQHVKDGMNAIREGRETTFAQEDAFSTLWHEITHNRNKPGKFATTKMQIQNMELANEFVARNTLPEFMKSIGGKLQNTELTINRTSTSYNTMVRNYDAVIEWCGAEKSKVVAAVSKSLFETDYSVQMKGLIDAMGKHSPYKIEELRRVIGNARDYPESYFKTFLDNNKHLLVEKGR